MHTLARRAEVYRLGEDGIWPAEPIMLEAADELELTSIGFCHQLGTLYVD